MRILVSGSTRTVGQLAASWPDQLGILLTPNNWNTVASVLATGLPWAVDNGAYTFHVNQRSFDPVPFRRLVLAAAGQPRLLWVVCPDVVGDARATLDLFDQWEPELRRAGVPVALVGQDGAERECIPWGRLDAWFVGGSTRWKLSEASADLCREAKRRGRLVHVGRVNSLRRLRWAFDVGAGSVDGSAYSRWRHTNHRRRDMSLERHLAYVRELEGSPCLFD